MLATVQVVDASERMSRQATKNTAPELQLRRRLHAQGLRYRVHRQPVAGLRRTADIVFPRQRVAVFVDGCFWHGCPEHGTSPKANADWWAAKLAKNVERDADTDRRLVEAGWLPIRIWEHEAPDEAAAKIRSLVGSRSHARREPRRT